MYYASTIFGGVGISQISDKEYLTKIETLNETTIPFTIIDNTRVCSDICVANHA